VKRRYPLLWRVINAAGLVATAAFPWTIPGELRWVGQTTRDTTSPQLRNALIMGRRTFESLPAQRRPLPGRLSVVVSRSTIAGVDCLPSLTAALDFIGEQREIQRAFLFGGYGIYAEALEKSLPDELLITKIPGDYDCDVFFPGFSLLEYPCIAEQEVQYGETGVVHSTHQRSKIS
jgi:dihydrofolate reductase